MHLREPSEGVARACRPLSFVESGPAPVVVDDDDDVVVVVIVTHPHPQQKVSADTAHANLVTIR